MNDTLHTVGTRLGLAALCALLWVSAAYGQAVEHSAATQAGNCATNTAEVAASPGSTAPALVETAATASKALGKTLDGFRRGSSGQNIVEFGRTVELKAGETVNDLVVIGSSATVRGRVRDAVVAVGGNVVVEGDVEGDVVAVVGSIRLGTNANVRGDAVAVMGGINLEPGAVIRGDTVAVGGRVTRAEGGEIGGEIMSITLPGFGWLSGMGDWVSECVFKLRPLSFKVGWVWALAGMFLLLYLLVALAFPRPVQACVDEITRRPATTVLMGLLTKLLIPVITLILVATGIGVFIVPFLFAALIFAGILGKVALLLYFGRQLGRQFGSAALQLPLVAFLIGWVLVTLLYLVPVLGMVVYGVTGVWALGAAVMAMFGGLRREMPERPSVPLGAPPPVCPVYPPTNPASATMVASLSPMAVTMPAEQPQGSDSLSSEPPVETPSPMPSGAVPPPPTSLPEAWALPRASFWERMGAAFLDVVLVSVLGVIVGGPPLGLLVALAYFAGMWAWKGTTVGGIVLNLQVARLDGQPVTFLVALVRGLAAAFSVIVFFLGFLWIAWDPDKQGWHDKIAGTVVVRLPRGQSLVCF